jgi:hypothetical protein
MYRVQRLVIFLLDCLPPSGATPARPPGRRSATSESSANQAAGVVLPGTFPFLFCEYFSVTKIYVGNLPFSATEESLRALFSAHGTVEKISLITDRDTGKPRGFGFVEMSNSDASRAMQALNGQDFEGRALRINEAQERQRSGGGGRGGPRRY